MWDDWINFVTIKKVYVRIVFITQFEEINIKTTYTTISMIL